MNDHNHDHIASVVDSPEVGHVNIAVDGGKAKITRLYGDRQRDFDASVLNAVRANGPTSAFNLRRQLDNSVTPNVLRASLHRLIEEGLVKSAGQKRATLYEAV